MFCRFSSLRSLSIGNTFQGAFYKDYLAQKPGSRFVDLAHDVFSSIEC